MFYLSRCGTRNTWASTKIQHCRDGSRMADATSATSTCALFAVSHCLGKSERCATNAALAVCKAVWNTSVAPCAIPILRKMWRLCGRETWIEGIAAAGSRSPAELNPAGVAWIKGCSLQSGNSTQRTVVWTSCRGSTNNGTTKGSFRLRKQVRETPGHPRRAKERRVLIVDGLARCLVALGETSRLVAKGHGVWTGSTITS